MIVFISKNVNGREKCAEEPKILCGCLASGFLFCGMVEKGQMAKAIHFATCATKALNHQQVGSHISY